MWSLSFFLSKYLTVLGPCEITESEPADNATPVCEVKRWKTNVVAPAARWTAQPMVTGECAHPATEPPGPFLATKQHGSELTFGRDRPFVG